MGLGYDRLRELNPRLVVTSIPGFGQTGPLAQRALFDAIAQAMSGFMSLTGKGEPRSPAPSSPLCRGLHGVIGTLLALHHREKTGVGQVVDVASLDAMFSCLSTYPSAAAMLGEVPKRSGSREPLTGPATSSRRRTATSTTRRDQSAVSPPLPGDGAAGTRHPRLRRRPRPESDNIEALEKIVGAWVAGRTIADAGAALTNAGIPWGPVSTIDEVIASPRIAAREMMSRSSIRSSARSSSPAFRSS